MSRRATVLSDGLCPWRVARRTRRRRGLRCNTAAYCSASIAYHAAPYVPEAVERLRAFFDGP
jgi:methionyl-tRNA synthetase